MFFIRTLTQVMTPVRMTALFGSCGDGTFLMMIFSQGLLKRAVYRRKCSIIMICAAKAQTLKPFSFWRNCPTTACPPKNWWLEEEKSTSNAPFSGDMLVFGEVMAAKNQLLLVPNLFSTVLFSCRQGDAFGKFFHSGQHGRHALLVAPTFIPQEMWLFFRKNQDGYRYPPYSGYIKGMIIQPIITGI